MRWHVKYQCCDGARLLTLTTLSCRAAVYKVPSTTRCCRMKAPASCSEINYCGTFSMVYFTTCDYFWQNMSSIRMPSFVLLILYGVFNIYICSTTEPTKRASMARSKSVTAYRVKLPLSVDVQGGKYHRGSA